MNLAILKNHFDKLEDVLLAKLQHAQTPEHPVDDGAAREIFLNEFLRGHLGENIGIGSGEIIDADAGTNDTRSQHDFIIYRKDYPKLSLTPGIHTFLAESVIATIEVKATLDQKGLEQAIKTAYTAKQLKRQFAVGNVNNAPQSAIRNYIFAFSDPQSMITVSKWFTLIHKQLEMNLPDRGSTLAERVNIPSPTLDGVVVLRKGILHVDNIHLLPAEYDDQYRAANPQFTHFVNNSEFNNLLYFFFWLTEAINQMTFSQWDHALYLPKE